MRREYPALSQRLYAVWYRHVRVYTRYLISNGFPPFIEPIIFLMGIGIGIGKYLPNMAGAPYLQFLATGLLVSTAMFTSAFECSFGAFIRLEFDKVYDGILSGPVTVNDLIIGEIIWAGTKGLFFSFAVMCVMALFNAVPMPTSLLAPIAGLITGVVFGILSLFITSFVRSINHFSFYFTGLISPMFFLGGTVFPIEELPPWFRLIAEMLPLSHCLRIVRGLCFWNFKATIILDILYIAAFILCFGYLAVNGMRRRLLD
ncbi:nodulation protein NodJ [Candidatus Magnetoovum chiemensis]|nr:nodulation protein NodJ [Candidatus Magnetoovum chiemensis]